MSDSDLERRIARLEATIERLADDTDADAAGVTTTRSTGFSRRSILQAVGLVGLGSYATGAASADPQGQVGTDTDPLRGVYTQEIAGGVTGETPLSSLVGSGLSVDDGALTTNVTDATSLGTGTDLFAGIDDGTLGFRSLDGGSNVSLNVVGDRVTIDASASSSGGESNTASNVGTGDGVFKRKVNSDLRFKSFVGGSNVTLSAGTDEITIDAASASGEANTASNVGIGAGTGLFKQKSGTDLEFKALVGGSNVNITGGSNTLTLDATATYPSVSDDGTQVLGASSDLNFGTNFGVTDDGDGTVTVDAATSGEANTASNVGSGTGVFKRKNGTDLEFKSFVQGSNVTITSGTNGLTLAATDTHTNVSDDGSIVTSSVTDVNFGTGLTVTNDTDGSVTVDRSTSDARTDVSDDGTTIVSDTADVNFGTNLAVTNDGDGSVTVNSSGEANDGANLGTGVGVYAGKTGSTLDFRSFVGGGSVSVSSTSGEITITGNGEANSAVNLGAGTPLYAGMSGTDLQFNSLVGGTNVTLSSSGGEVTLDATDTRTDVSDGGTTVVPSVTDIDFGTGLTVTDGSDGTVTVDQSASDTRTDVSDDGTTVVSDTTDVNFGTNLGVTDDGDGTVTVNSSGEANDGANLGTGVGVYAGKTGSTLDFRSFVGGGSVSVSSTSGEITITGNGEANSAVNLGAGTPLYAGMSGTDLQFNTLVGGSNVTLSSSGGEVTLDAPDTRTDVSDGGTTVVPSVTDIDFGADLGVTNDGDGTVTVDSTASGEANTASNVGTASSTGLFKQKSGTDLEFKSLVGGSNVTLSSNSSEVTVNATDTSPSVSHDGTQVLAGPGDVNFGTNLDVTDDGDGTVTVTSAASTTGTPWDDPDADDLLEPVSPYTGIDLSGVTNPRVVTPWVGTTTKTDFEAFVNGTRAAQFATNGTVLLGQYAQETGGPNGATAAGGYSSRVNSVEMDYATVSGGASNTASGRSATVGGGESNAASGQYATVPGGETNVASGNFSFAAGSGAEADALGTFVWADAQSGTFAATDTKNGSGVSGGDTFNVQSQNGARFITSAGTAYISSTSAAWSNTSTKTAKTNFQPIDTQDVLEGVSSLDVATWEYKDDDGAGAGERHLGPTAERFHEAFELGDSERHINSINADGVAFAAIQGLLERVDSLGDDVSDRDDQIEDLEGDLAAKDERIDRLEDRLAAVEQAIDGRD